jgi:hypothetical protein
MEVKTSHPVDGRTLRRTRPLPHDPALRKRARKFSALLKVLDMSQTQVGRFLDLDGRTVRRWASGDRPIPIAVEIVLTYMARNGLTPKEILAACKIKRQLDVR